MNSINADKENGGPETSGGHDCSATLQSSSRPKSKVLKVTLQAMARSSTDLQVCAGGCKVLCDATLGQVSSKHEVICHGGIVTVLDALKRHSNDAGTAKQALLSRHAGYEH